MNTVQAVARPVRPQVVKWGWVWPRWSDPRIPFAAILSLYGVLGFCFFGFNRSPAQMAAIVVSGSVLDAGLTWLLRREKVVPLSGYISCCSLALLLNYSHSSWLLLLPVWLTIGSKYVLTFQGRHVFNPSMFGVATSLLLTRELITAAPAYQWANGEIALSAFILMAALVLFFFRVGRGWLVVSFLAFYALQTALRAYILRHHLPPEVLFLGTLGAPPFFIFVFYMITDPGTSPARPRDQVLLALALTLVDLVLHLKESVFTFFYAALTCATARFLFLHARALWREGGRAYVKGLLSPGPLQRLGAVGALGVVLAAGYGFAVAPAERARALPFHLERLEASHTGLGSTLGDVITSVDPRVLHVSKWVLSVGDAVAAGDYDGDGLLDLFLSNALKSDGDRAALFRNLGGLRFERVRMPVLDAIAANYTREGAAAGGTFVDYDGDGDQDLLIAVAFGPSRLLRNQLRETGQATFEDVTQKAGVADHSVSIATTMLDYDRDGHLDLLVANALTTHLPDYATPTPFNLFHLPPPEYPGDRRMLRFMHNGWHDADNGGLNALYRGRGDGTFEKVDPAVSGLTETRWSLAVSTVDLNQDGWTDLYIANDFGPDEVYLNEPGAQGRHFRRLRGTLFGEIGKDTYKGMNSTVADFDRNGWLDVYVSNVHHSLQAEGSLLWMVSPGEDGFVPTFKDEATARGALNERRFGWGAAAGDLDNDGWPDLVQANGHLDDRMDHRIDSGRKDYWYINHKLMQSGPEVHTYADKWGDIRGRTVYPNEARRAYLNLGEEHPGHFVDVAKQLGLDDPDNSRGVLLADLDNDGDLDSVITNQHGPVSVYRNTLREGAGRDAAHFVGLSLEGHGTHTSRAAVGTRVVVSYEEEGRHVEQVREVGLLGGLSASADPRLHFGLGRHAGPVTATVHWYGGAVQTVPLEADRYHVLRQPSVTAQDGH